MLNLTNPDLILWELLEKLISLPEKLNIFIQSDDRAANLVKAITFQSFTYASEMVPEIADTGKPIDDAMRWGFGHEAGPFETWDSLGVRETLPLMVSEGFSPAQWVSKMLDSGCETFYQYDGETEDWSIQSSR